MELSYKMNPYNKITLSIISLYTLLIVCMGIATIVEKIWNTAYAAEIIYGSWWFISLWAATVVLSLVYLIKKKTYRRMGVMLLHLSFIVILAGALTTHILSSDGTLHLRKGVESSSFTEKNGKAHTLPFKIKLNTFDILYYPGTDAIMDYKAHVSITINGQSKEMIISMNNIGKEYGYRFYQSSYDSDGNGTTLLVTHDPYGIAITYAGYLMLLIGLLLTLASKHTRIRNLFHIATRPAVLLLLLLTASIEVKAAGMDSNISHKISSDIADKMGQVAVLYNGRICPLNTAANDFVTKLCGKNHWDGYSANEIFLGWTIYYIEWEQCKIIKVRNKEVQGILGIDGKWASVRDFYTSQNEYKLKGKAVDAGIDDATRKAIREVDEKIQVITMFYNSEMLRIFPLADKGRIEWHKPGSTDLPQDVDQAEFLFIHHALDYMVKSILDGDKQGAKTIIAKIKLYQEEKAGDLLPSPFVMRAETICNDLLSASWIAIVCMVLSIVFSITYFAGWQKHGIRHCHHAFIALLSVYLTVLILLRWMISGHAPMSNGFETMLFMSWAAMAISIIIMRRMTIMKVLGPLVASCCLLVAVMAVGSPQITPLMPVLQSPLLTIHVGLVMIAYSLIFIITLISIFCLLPMKWQDREYVRVTALSRFLLYPAVALLALGIFVGAVWANVSWGCYWSWDPKEIWALITMMVYAVPLHDSSPCSTKTRGYHRYILIAFLTVLMTYFGVNYFLSGLHSYA